MDQIYQIQYQQKRMFEPTTKNFWRGIVLYGSNQSTYKIGLAERLLDYANRNITKVPLDEFGDNMERIEEYRKEKEEEESRKKRYLENLDSEDEESGQFLGTK